MMTYQQHFRVYSLNSLFIEISALLTVSHVSIAQDDEAVDEAVDEAADEEVTPEENDAEEDSDSIGVEETEEEDSDEVVNDPIFYFIF